MLSQPMRQPSMTSRIMMAYEFTSSNKMQL
jgi:hypothetical protein